MPLPTTGAFPPVVTPVVTPRVEPLVSPGVTPMVSLWKTPMVSLCLFLSLCKLNFHEIDALTHHGSIPPVVTPAVTPGCPHGDHHGVPVVNPFSL